MIIGIFLRYIKTYRGFNYIPIYSGDNFCGLVGNNGVGKSSVLEALDSIFNNAPLNLNIATRKSGKIETDPHVVPIFLISKDKIDSKYRNLAELLHKIAFEITETDGTNASLKKEIKKYIDHRNMVFEKIDINDHYLIPIGFNFDRKTSISLFNCKKFTEYYYEENPRSSAENSPTTLKQEDLDNFEGIIDQIINTYKYIYIPKEIDSDSFTKLETKEIQTLMGKNLHDIIEALVPATTIKDINNKLSDYINDLSSNLGKYSYRTNTERQIHLKKIDVYNLIIQAYFNIRILHKKFDQTWLEIKQLSSGEKQKAIIDLASSLIKQHPSTGKNLRTR